MLLNPDSLLDIQARANGKTESVLHRGLPLVISVSIINNAAMQNASYNRALEMKLRDLRKRRESGDISDAVFDRDRDRIRNKKLPVTTWRIGGPARWPDFIRIQQKALDAWRNIDWPLHLVMASPGTQIAELDDVHGCYAEFGLDPEEVAGIPDGEYILRAVVTLVGKETLDSDPITLKITHEELSAEEQVAEQLFYDRGAYSLQRGFIERARETVRQGLEIYPTSLMLLGLSGDIEVQAHNTREALRIFEKALEEFSRQHPDAEPPRVFISKIARLSEG
jgi:tetratricopeptide (TPR) repeat protein